MTGYDWLMIAFVAMPILYVALGAIAISLNTNQRLSRPAFAVRIMILIGVGLALLIVTPVNIEGPNRIYGAIEVAILHVFAALTAYWSAGRLRDTGVANRWRALIVLVPLFGMAYVVYLMMARPARAKVQ